MNLVISKINFGCQSFLCCSADCWSLVCNRCFDCWGLLNVRLKRVVQDVWSTFARLGPGIKSRADGLCLPLNHGQSWAAEPASKPCTGFAAWSVPSLSCSLLWALDRALMRAGGGWMPLAAVEMIERQCPSADSSKKPPADWRLSLSWTESLKN